MAKGLTKKQELFVAEYLVSLNATKAAISAGYSEKTADSQGIQLLRNPKIAEKVAKKSSKLLEKLDVSSERILGELEKIAFFDPRKMFEADGSPKQIHELDDKTASCVAGFEVVELFEGSGEQKHAYGLAKKVKLSDRLRALEMLGKYRKLFTDRSEISGLDGSPIQSEHRIVFVDPKK